MFLVMTKKILFVCLGNICRSPAAEGIMKHLVQEAGLNQQIFCDSAGTSNYHIGELPDSRMIMMARQRGIHLDSHARQLHPDDLEKFDLILAMDKENLADIYRLDPHHHHQAKIKLMCDYCQNHDLQEVPDPYYGGRHGFELVLDLLTDACQGLLAELKTQLPTTQS